MKCFNCGKELIDIKYNVKYVDENGELKFENCCSEKCCEDVVYHYSGIHMRRYDDTRRQCFQKEKI